MFGVVTRRFQGWANGVSAVAVHRPLSAQFATAAAAAKPAVAAASKPAAGGAAAAGKPAAANAKVVIIGASSRNPPPVVAGPPEPVIAMKRGLKSYLPTTKYELTVAYQKPWMEARRMRQVLKMPPIRPVAFKLYGEGLKVDLSEDKRAINVEAKYGKAQIKLHESVVCALDEAKQYVFFSAAPNFPDAKKMMGTTRAHLANAVHGCHFGHSRRLKLVGVGYRAKVEGQMIEMRVGFSHPVFYTVPDGVTPSMPTKDTIALKGVDIAAVMLHAAKIRDLRPPNAYTGQGIRYSNEVFVAKPGKKKSS